MKKCQVVVKREEPVTINNVIYGECQKNQAVNIGGYAMDGYREFLASGAEGTSAAITCVACGCHRNFHKKMENIKVVCESSAPPARGST